MRQYVPTLSVNARRLPIHRNMRKLHIFRGMSWLGGWGGLWKIEHDVLRLTCCPHPLTANIGFTYRFQREQDESAEASQQ